ncbi:MAG: hypothetical protein ACXVEB_18185, partial [Bacteroidia bacterium]
HMDVFSNDALPVKERLYLYIDGIIEFYAEYPQMSMFIIKEIGNRPEILKQKIQIAKKHKTIKLIQVLEEAIKNKEIKKFDTAMFLVNLQSLCTYPFLASSMFRHSLKSHGKDWEKDFSTEKLKQSVKDFVEFTFGK